MRRRAERDAARAAHPFDRTVQADPAQGLFDDGRAAEALLVAFAGARGKLGVAPADVFELVADLDVRRVFLRGLDPVGAARDPAGLQEVIDVFRDRFAELAAPHRPVVFLGNSFGAYAALFYGTLCGADAVIAVDPTTSLRTEVRASLGDTRWSWLDLSGHDALPASQTDVLALWEEVPPPRVVMHYAYRNDVYRGHAERIAGLRHVRPVPHYEQATMAAIRDDGSLRADLGELLGFGRLPPVRPPAPQAGAYSPMT